MIVLTAAVGFNVDQVRPFMESLKATGYDDKIMCICDSSPAREYLVGQGVIVLDDINNGFDINSRRFFVWKEALRGVDEPVILTDIRDVVFQAPVYALPFDGINVYTEDECMTLGTCPYNNQWLKTIFTENPYAPYPIVCAGITTGHLTEYCMLVWEMLKGLPTSRGLDQAIHNHIVYGNKLPTTIHTNPSPVYTVGYVQPYDSLIIEDGVIKGPDGSTPIMVHQHDRHPKIKEQVLWQ